MIASVTRRALLMVAVLLMALDTEASQSLVYGIVTVSPSSPSSQDTINVVIDVVGGCRDIVTTSVNGPSIRTDIVVQEGCFVGGPSVILPEFVRLGPLTPGTYTYEVYINSGGGPVLDWHQAILVVPAIPILDEVGLSILAAALAAIACVTMSKRG